MTFSEFLLEYKWFLLMPVIIMVLSTILRLTKEIIKGAYYLDVKDELEKRTDKIIKEEEQKIVIDKDLEKYFNYKESKDV